MDIIQRRYKHNVNRSINTQSGKLTVNICQAEVNIFHLNYSDSGRRFEGLKYLWWVISML